jgi:hypothetical protein
MRITEENGESFDCRPLIDELTMPIPEYLKGRAARAARAAAERPAGEPGAAKVKPTG